VGVIFNTAYLIMKEGMRDPLKEHTATWKARHIFKLGSFVDVV